MKFWSLEHGEDPYKIAYTNGPAYSPLNDGQKALTESYIGWAITREKSCFRMCFYERSETGVMNMYDKFEWNCVKPRPRVINKPKQEDEIPF